MSCIGYKSKVFTLVSDEYNALHITPSISSLPNITLIPVDRAKELMKDVLKNIPANYPTQLERVEGYIHENAYRDSLKQVPLYESIAKIEADKFDYSDQINKSNVHVIENDARFYQGADSVTTLGMLIGSIHFIHDMDIVMRRSGLLTLENMDKYEYKLVDTVSYDTYRLIKLQYENKRYRGTLYIDIDSKAVVKREGELLNDALGIFNLVGGTRVDGIDMRYSRSSVEYGYTEGRWRIKYAETNFHSKLQNGLEIYFERLYSVENHYEVDEPIRMNLRTSKVDHITNKATNKNSRGATDFSVEKFSKLNKQRGSSTPEQIDFDPSQNLHWSLRYLLKFASVYTPSFSFNVRPYNSPEFSYINERFGLVGVKKPIEDFYYTLTFKHMFRLDNTSSLHFAFEINPSSNNNYFSSFLGYMFTNDLNLTGTWLYSIGVDIGRREMRYRLGSFDNGSSFTYNGEHFNQSTVDLFAQQNEWFVSPSASLILNTGSFFRLKLSASYTLPLSREAGLYIEEMDEGFFGIIDDTFENKGLGFKGKDLFTNQFSFGVGFIFGFAP